MSSPVRVDANIWFPGITKRTKDCFFNSICLLRPQSRGAVTLADANPRSAPRIALNLLQHPDDWERLKKGLAISRRIFAPEPMVQYLVEETFPGQHVDNDAALDAMKAELAGVVHHPGGSCAMGTGPEAVVDPQLRVRGVDGLRIADASIMPRLVGANTNAAAVMIGEKAADLVLGRTAPEYAA